MDLRPEYAFPQPDEGANYPKFGELQKRASALGLVMSRDRISGHLHLRYRDRRDPRPGWRHMTFQEASAVVDGLEVRALYQARAARRN
jgi:hypothetical protein